MLPAYLALVVQSDGKRGTAMTAVGRAVAATAAMALGFITVFGTFGLLTIAAASTVQRYLPYVTVVVGIVLVAVGIWLLIGRDLGALTRMPDARWVPNARLGS